MSVFDAVRVELELLSCDGVHEGVDHLVKCIEEKRNVDDERSPETLGVVILEDIQDLRKQFRAE